MANIIYDVETGPNYFISGNLNTADMMIDIFGFFCDEEFEEPLPFCYSSDHIFRLRFPADPKRISDPKLPLSIYGVEYFNNNKLSDNFIQLGNDSSFQSGHKRTDQHYWGGTINLRIDDFENYNAKNAWFIGFNNSTYDDYLQYDFYRALNEIRFGLFSVYDFIQSQYTKSHSMIEKGIYKGDVVEKSIDLKKVARTDKSLKLIGCTLNYFQIMDFPVDPHKRINVEQLNKLLTYLVYDLEITYLMFDKMKPSLKLRKEISLKYKLNVMSMDNTGIGITLFEKFYAEFTNRTVLDLKFISRKTVHPRKIKLKEILFPFVELFPTKTSKFIKELSDIMVDCSKDKITFELPSFIYGGHTYNIGGGGLHSVDSPGTFISDHNWEYTDCDVTSYYPNLIISYKLHPPQLDDNFWKLIDKLTQDRVAAKKRGDKVTSDSLKETILSIFGKLGEKTNWFYSPETFLKITVNGQLALLLLITRLVDAGFEVISANTDGIITKVNISRKKYYHDICEQWEKDIKVNLEYTVYQVYARTTVNSYVAYEMGTGTRKTKNEFIEDDNIVKNDDAKIIPKALNEYVLQKYVLRNNHFSVVDYIKNTTDITLFMYGKKPASSDWSNYGISPKGNRIKLSKTLRFAVVKKSFPARWRIVKIKKGKTGKESKQSYIANEYLGIANRFDDVTAPKLSDISYDFYISSVMEKINLIESNLNRLF